MKKTVSDIFSFTPQDWKKAGFDLYKATQWRDNGFDLDEAVYWWGQHFTPQEARKKVIELNIQKLRSI